MVAQKKAAGSSPAASEGRRRGRSVRPRLPGTLGQSRWADLGEVKVPEAEPPDHGAHLSGGHATKPMRWLSSAFPAAKPRQNAIAIVVERQADGGDDRDERDRGDVLLPAHVRAE